ncbi:hypothetical protein B484DRAFT_411584 [Ochromonadaceae sp. CCMP2298]|nr:hypothetical protein B484DRAFT_411584 [Ochromonadaceae sp. CCMP2298]
MEYQVDHLSNLNPFVLVYMLSYLLPPDLASLVCCSKAARTSYCATSEEVFKTLWPLAMLRAAVHRLCWNTPSVDVLELWHAASPFG